LQLPWKSRRTPLLETQPNDFSTLADEYATAGGINEQFLTALRRAGTFNVVDRALDDVADRLQND
jgi:pyrroline-5-carboxylate reductase